MKIVESTKGEVVIYKTKDSKTSLEIRLEKETIWLTQKPIAELFVKGF